MANKKVKVVSKTASIDRNSFMSALKDEESWNKFKANTFSNTNASMRMAEKRNEMVKKYFAARARNRKLVMATKKASSVAQAKFIVAKNALH